MSGRTLPELAEVARRRLLRMHFEAGVGHIGGNLSCLDLLVTLFCACLFDEDRFVLSKGHAAGALYVALWISGRLPEAALDTFHREGTLLAGHPVAGWHRDVSFGTGSLGHGLSLAAGVAQARLLTGRPGIVYCLMSDGELNEGSVWEALHYAAHHGLGNLVIIVDQNGLQGFGETRETVDLGDLSARLGQLALDVASIDGHQLPAIEGALRCPRSARTGRMRPTVILAKTIKGHGVSFMMNKMEWHYLPLDAEQYALASAELAGGRAMSVEEPQPSDGSILPSEAADA